MNASQPLNLSRLQPASYQALLALSAAAEADAQAAGIDPLLVELVKIRTSQINGCAFCLRMHTRDALAKGETSDRLAVVRAWRETDYFSAAERAALALTEAVTDISTSRGEAGHTATVGDETGSGALTDAQASAVAWLAIVMNAFNRVAITSRYPVTPNN